MGKNALLFTIGHEEGHLLDFSINILKDYNLSLINRYKCECFICRTNEVYSDFNGGLRMGGKINEIVDVINFKLNKLSDRKKNKIYRKYPSWIQRINYIKQGKFSESLIRQIARDTNFNNEDVIKKVINYFLDKNIILH